MAEYIFGQFHIFINRKSESIKQREITEKCRLFILDSQNQMEQESMEIKEKSAQEMNEWAKITEEHLHAIQNLQKVCYYCSEKLSPISLNSECPINSYQIQTPNCQNSISL